MCSIYPGCGARRIVPEHRGAGKEPATGNGDNDVAAADRYGAVVGAGEGRRRIAERFLGKDEGTADEEDLIGRGVRGRGGGDEEG